VGKCDFERRRHTQGLHKKENEHANHPHESQAVGRDRNLAILVRCSAIEDRLAFSIEARRGETIPETHSGSCLAYGVQEAWVRGCFHAFVPQVRIDCGEFEGSAVTRDTINLRTLKLGGSPAIFVSDRRSKEVGGLIY
jgi:hypothetical protein